MRLAELLNEGDPSLGAVACCATVKSYSLRSFARNGLPHGLDVSSPTGSACAAAMPFAFSFGTRAIFLERTYGPSRCGVR